MTRQSVSRADVSQSRLIFTISRRILRACACVCDSVLKKEEKKAGNEIFFWFFFVRD